jgi:hypothetical protein
MLFWAKNEHHRGRLRFAPLNNLCRTHRSSLSARCDAEPMVDSVCSNTDGTHLVGSSRTVEHGKGFVSLHFIHATGT